MTSKSRVVTDNIRVLSSAESIEAQAQQSKQSASSDNTQTSTKTSSAQSGITLTTGKSVSEKSVQYSVLLRVVLSSLEKAGLVKKYRVLSKDKSVVKEYQIIFDPAIWTEKMELRLLSSPTTAKEEK